MKKPNYYKCKCILCEKDESESLFECGQYGINIHVSICKNDGLVFLNPRWSKEQYNYFYENIYDNYYRNQNNPEESNLFSEKIIKRLNQIHNFSPKSILDVGAGMGHILKNVSDNFSSIKIRHAIEPSIKCKESLSKFAKVKTIASNIDEDSIKNKFNFYDLIILRHSLEHFLDPKEVILKLKNLLSENGILYVAVPNMMKPTGSLKYYWFRAVHTFYFNETTFLRLFNQCGINQLFYKSEDDELWGIFNSNDKYQNNIYFRNTYKEQKQLIKLYLREYYYLDLYEKIKIFFIKFIPVCIKPKIREYYLIAKSMFK